jgi:glycosyltransferase involved in cell wall biosynthesis
MNSKVSIIVPIYNVEKELSRCIDSLLKQSYINIEVILIDDGSTDSCSELCDRYVVIDSRLRVIHRENGGLSAARNSGLDVVTGKYIAFVDADDWVAEDFIETLVTNMEREDADISIVGYTMIWDDGRKRRFSSDKQYYVFERDEAIRELLIHKKFQCMVCQKMYKAEIFNKLRFPEGKLYEDVAVGLPSFLLCNKVVCCGKSKYFYYQRSGSIVNSKFSRKKLYFLDCCKQIIQYSDSIDGKYDMEAHSYYLRGIMMILLQIYDSAEENEQNEIISHLRREIRQQKRYLWTSPYLENRKKVVLILMSINFPKKILLKLWKIR